MAKIRVMLTCNLLDLGGTEKTIQIFAKYLENVSKGQPHVLLWVGGRHQLELGDILSRLYSVTKNEKFLTRAATDEKLFRRRSH